MAKLKELGELSLLLAKVVSSLDEKLVDKKLSWLETISLTLELLPNVGTAFTGIKDIPAELAASTTQDLINLAAEVAANLDLRTERTEQIAIKAVNMAIYATDLILTIRNKPQMVRGFGTAGELVEQTPIKIGDEKDVIL